MASVENARILYKKSKDATISSVFAGTSFAFSVAIIGIHLISVNSNSKEELDGHGVPVSSLRFSWLFL